MAQQSCEGRAGENMWNMNITKNRQDVVRGPSMAATSYDISMSYDVNYVRFTPDAPRSPKIFPSQVVRGTITQRRKRSHKVFMRRPPDDL